MDASSDHDLMLQIGAGRVERMALLYDRHRLKLFNFFVKLGHPRSAGEDLVHDTFLRMLRYAASYGAGRHGDSALSFLAWMFQVARHVAADAFNVAPRHEVLDEAQEPEWPTSPEHDPAGVQEQLALERRLLRALHSLPRDTQELILLSRIRELSMQELADLFGCETGAVKVRLHRAVKQLRLIFDGMGDELRPGGSI